MLFVFFSMLTAYLLGSFPTAYIFGKLLRGIDIRQHGSGNVGATNVARVVGKGPGIVVFFIDFSKGLAAVTFLPGIWNQLFPSNISESTVFYLSLAALVVAGHIWTCFLKFKGGKGVATTAGAMLGLYPAIFISAMLVWVIVFYICKYVSLASLAAAVALPLLSVFMKEDLSTTIFMAILCMLGVFSHRSNIKRLVQGTENRVVSVKKR